VRILKREGRMLSYIKGGPVDAVILDLGWTAKPQASPLNSA